eukprot:GHVR01070358.1.p1 GENE.GHVR01070358.1~~GHVR01070358.1.p1  ORF type:complete len:161 (+),score=26.21 GHVR01070358.1:81-563(+)
MPSATPATTISRSPRSAPMWSTSSAGTPTGQTSRPESVLKPRRAAPPEDLGEVRQCDQMDMLGRARLLEAAHIGDHREKAAVALARGGKLKPLPVGKIARLGDCELHGLDRGQRLVATIGTQRGVKALDGGGRAAGPQHQHNLIDILTRICAQNIVRRLH